MTKRSLVTTDVPRARETVVIKPVTGPMPIRPGELWAFRELFMFLVMRDIKVRYAQTALGAMWSIFQPLAMMGVYAYAFTRLGRLTTGHVPYPLFALSGLVLWIFVSRAVVQGTLSLLTDLQVVTKTAAPRMIVPLAAVGSVLIDFTISLALFLAFNFGYGRMPRVETLVIFPIMLATIALTYGLALFLSALNVKYRDVGQALPFLVQLWFFVSPVAYTLHTPGRSFVTVVQALNPLVGLIEAARWALVGSQAPRGLLIIAIVEAFVIFVLGMAYFSRRERSLADDV